MEKKNQLSLWYFVDTMVLLLMVQEAIDPRHAETLGLQRFQAGAVCRPA